MRDLALYAITAGLAGEAFPMPWDDPAVPIADAEDLAYFEQHSSI